MPIVKLDSKFGKEASEALSVYADEIYETDAGRYMAVVEFGQGRRTIPPPDQDEDPSVALRIVRVELGSEAQAPVLRQLQTALKAARTCAGTLTEDHDLDAVNGELERAAGDLQAVEVARLRTAIKRIEQIATDALKPSGYDSDFELRAVISEIIDKAKTACYSRS